MRDVRRLAALCAALLAVSGPVEADCTGIEGRVFTTMSGDCCGGLTYISTPGDHGNNAPVSNVAVGYFWSMGYGSPDTFWGVDNLPGSADNDCGVQARVGNNYGGNYQGWCGSPFNNDGVKLWWNVPIGGTNSYIGGNLNNWTNVPDGCVDWDGSVTPPDHVGNNCPGGNCLDLDQCMAVLLADDPDGTTGHFLVMTDDADNAGFYNLNAAVAFVPEVDLKPVPPPQNVVASLDGGNTVVTLGLAEPGLDPFEGRIENCLTTNPFYPTLEGYKIYTQVLPDGELPAGRNVRKAWTGRPLGSCEGALGQRCTTDAQCDINGPCAGFCAAVPAQACTNDAQCDVNNGPCERGWIQRKPDPLMADFVPFGGTDFTETACVPGDKIHVCATLVLNSNFETPYCSESVIVECQGCLENVDCNDGVACTADTCDTENGACQNVPDDALCNDGVSCTTDICNASTDCENAPDDAACDDGLFCTGVETCDTVGDCQTGVAPCSILANCDETDQVCFAGVVGDLTVDKGGGNITLSWSSSCLDEDTDYAIYEGTLGVFYDHASKFCTTDEQTFKTFAAEAGNNYYLVVPFNPDREGSYGTDSDDQERPVGAQFCKTRAVGTCPP